MCRYKMSIEMEYGVMNINLGDIYKEAMVKYNKVKADYSEVPCKMIVKDNEDVLFIKDNKEQSFDKLYNQLLSILAEMSKLQLNMSKKEKRFTALRNEMYHELECKDLSELNTEEQAEYLMKMKSELNKRRIIESQNQKQYAFFDTFTKIYNLVIEYEEKREKMEHHGCERFGKAYYKEDVSAKKERAKRLLGILNNK